MDNNSFIVNITIKIINVPMLGASMWVQLNATDGTEPDTNKL